MIYIHHHTYKGEKNSAEQTSVKKDYCYNCKDDRLYLEKLLYNFQQRRFSFYANKHTYPIDSERLIQSFFAGQTFTLCSPDRRQFVNISAHPRLQQQRTSLPSPLCVEIDGFADGGRESFSDCWLCTLNPDGSVSARCEQSTSFIPKGHSFSFDNFPQECFNEECLRKEIKKEIYTF